MMTATLPMSLWFGPLGVGTQGSFQGCMKWLKDPGCKWSGDAGPGMGHIWPGLPFNSGSLSSKEKVTEAGEIEGWASLGKPLRFHTKGAPVW